MTDEATEIDLFGSFDFGEGVDLFLNPFSSEEDEEEDDFDHTIFDEDQEAGGPFATRYLKPKVTFFNADQITSDNARKLAHDIGEIREGHRVDALISGSFVFGDFFEQYLREHNLKTERMVVATLSLSKDNVDSFARLIREGVVKHLDLIVSSYFYANERHAGGLIPYIVEELDLLSGGDRFQLAVCGSHCKITLFETDKGDKIVAHGSANLRSSANIEQVCIEGNSELYSFYLAAFDNIIDRYKTINREIRYKELFEVVSRKRFRDDY